MPQSPDLIGTSPDTSPDVFVFPFSPFLYLPNLRNDGMDKKSDLLFRTGPTLLWPFLAKRPPPLLPVVAFVGEGDCILSEGGGTGG